MAHNQVVRAQGREKRACLRLLLGPPECRATESRYSFPVADQKV